MAPIGTALNSPRHTLPPTREIIDLDGESSPVRPMPMDLEQIDFEHPRESKTLVEIV